MNKLAQLKICFKYFLFYDQTIGQVIPELTSNPLQKIF